MSREEREKKPKEELSKIRQDAAQMEEAIQANEERAKGRTFANPQNADEAEGRLPTMEQLTSKVLIKTKDGWRRGTKEEILREGTLLEKLRLYYSSRDLDLYFDTDGKFSKDDIAYIRDSIRSEKDVELVKLCSKEFNTLIEFGRRLSYQFKRFQASFAMLAVLLNRWDGYEQTAKKITFLFNFKLSDQLADYVDADKYPYEPIVIYKDDIDKFYSTDKVEAFLKGYGSTFYFDGATLKVDKDRCAFVVDVDGKGNLYSQITKEAKETARELCDFKAYAQAAEEYVAASTLRYTPVSIQMSIENAEEERYTRYLVKNLSFFRSELNERRERGETITPEEEKRAVIPDYDESKPTAKIYRECKRGFKLIESGNAL